METAVHAGIPATAVNNTTPLHDILAFASAALWPLCIIILLIAFRKPIAQLSQMIMTRVRDGGALKLWQFELGQTYISGGSLASTNAIRHIRDADGTRHRQRDQTAQDSRRVYIVHRLQTSNDATQLYDVMIYAVPTGEGTLSSVRRIEYYFGRSWGYLVYTSSDRAKGFSITLSAWGPFLCTAKIVFTDSSHFMMYRFIDFEMGAAGGGSAPRDVAKDITRPHDGASDSSAPSE